MPEYISREAARPDTFCEGVSCQDCPFCKDLVHGGCRIDDFVKSIPAADVMEVRHGRWIVSATNLHFDSKCSACGETFYSPLRGAYIVHYSKYCPNCGAKMDGGQDE